MCLPRHPRCKPLLPKTVASIVDHNRTLAEAQLPLPVVREVVQAILADQTLRPQLYARVLTAPTLIAKTALRRGQSDYFFNNLVRVDDLTQVNDTIYKINGEWPNDSIQTIAAKLNAHFPGFN